MQSGKLRFLVTIQNPIRTTSADGDIVTTWNDFNTVYADVRTNSGTETEEAEHVKGVSKNIVFTRWVDNVTPEMRVKFGNKNLNIETIGEDRTHERMLVLNCREDLDV